MCDLFGDGGAAAAQAAAQQQQIQAQEDQRQAAIGTGKQSIDDAFKQFDDPYYANYTKSYTDAQDAPLADQYGLAKDQLTAALAGRDTLESTGGAQALSQLDKTNEDAQSSIGAAATDATNTLKTNVNNQKNALYAENTSAADPLAAATSAQATAGALVAPSSVQGLGNVFAGALAPFATAAKTNASSLYPSSIIPSFAAPISGNGSGVFS